VVFSLLTYVIVKFRRKAGDRGSEPAQVYGSTQIELAWTVIPILIVAVLFAATARVIHAIQDAPKPPTAIEVTVIGHQFWWEFRYPKLGIVTANELHIPASDPAHPTPTFLKLLSADTDHSFWVPELGGKTDLIPNRVNEMWLDPPRPGIYLGQCAQYCGTQHANMLLRVVAQAPDDFKRWAAEQQRPAAGNPAFQSLSCVSCHTIKGTPAKGKFGPDLTHLMSRQTLAAGAIANTPENLRQWVKDPQAAKPGSLMPSLQLTDQELGQVVNYLESLQ